MELPSSVYSNYPSATTVDEPIRYRVSVTTILRRFLNARKCISSKSAWLLLVLNFTVYFLYLFWYPPDFVATKVTHKSLRQVLYSGTGCFVYALCPIAGVIADNKIGRHRMIRFSIWMLVPGFSLAILNTAIATVTHIETEIKYVNIFILVIALAFLTFAITGFTANSIQFGVDQLLDSPWEDQRVFIAWFVWAYDFAKLIFVLFDFLNQVNHGIDNEMLSAILLAFIVIFTILLLILMYLKKEWFLSDSRKYNPYKLVYKVTKFSRLHKVPVNRSAFTYCEDEIPSGLDLGKRKYGGPFTTEEVEDVKAFYGILKVIFTTVPTFFLFGTFYSTNGYFRDHLTILNQSYTTNFTVETAITSAVLQDLHVFIIPLYLLILRPFISYYTPGTLKRMALGIVVPTLLAVVFLVVDSLAHAENRSLQCMFIFDIVHMDNPASWSEIAVFISQRYVYIKSTFHERGFPLLYWDSMTC